jgi:hypothetical protein
LCYYYYQLPTLSVITSASSRANIYWLAVTVLHKNWEEIFNFTLPWLELMRALMRTQTNYINSWMENLFSNWKSVMIITASLQPTGTQFLSSLMMIADFCTDLASTIWQQVNTYWLFQMLSIKANTLHIFFF